MSREQYKSKGINRASIEGLLELKEMDANDQFRLAARILTIKKVLIDNNLITEEEFNDISEGFFKKLQEKRTVMMNRKASSLRWVGKKK